MYFDAFKKYLLENKCTHYMIDNLRTPPQTLVRQWGKQLKMDSADVERISDRVKLRFALGKIFTIKLSQLHIFILFFYIFKIEPDAGQLIIIPI